MILVASFVLVSLVNFLDRLYAVLAAEGPVGNRG